MAKITDLPLAGALIGTEQTVISQGGLAKRAPFSDVIEAAIAPALAAADASADQAAADADRAEAYSTNEVPVDSFAAIAGRTIPATISMIRTLGYAAKGDGGGAIYVDDALSDAALAAAHPRAVGVTANARYFRLLPEGGAVLPEQFGAVGDGVGNAGTNDQPALQACANYCRDTKIFRIVFTKRQYNLWAIQRTSPISLKYATDGETLVFEKNMELFSSAGTTLKFLGRTGNRNEVDAYLIEATPGSGLNQVWRPCGIFLLGDHNPYPNPSTFSKFTMDGITLEGSCDRTVNEGTILYAGVNLVSMDGWGSDKGIRIQDVVLNEVQLSNGEIRGFKGELFYVGGYGPDKILLNNFHLRTTNGDAFNPGGIGKVFATDCEFGDSFQCVEALGGKGQFYNNCRFYNSSRATLIGGRVDIGLAGNYSYPNRDETQAAGWINLNGCRFENITNNINIGSYVRGDISLVDTGIVIGDNSSGCRDVYLKIDHWTDLSDNQDAVTVNGPASLTTQIAGMVAGTYIKPPSNMRFEITQHRTRLAQDAGRAPGKAFGWSAAGYIDKSVSVIVDGREAKTPPQADAADPKSFPYIRIDRMALEVWGGNDYGSQWYGATIDVDTTLKLRGPAILIGSSLAAGSIVSLTMPLAPAAGGTQYGFVEGQEVVIVNSSNNINFVFSGTASNVRLRAAFRVLKNNHDWIRFRWAEANAKWEEIAFHCSTADTAPLAVAYAANVTLDFRLSKNFVLGPLTGAINLVNPANMKAGDRFEVLMPQDGVGGRLGTYGTAWKFFGPKVLSVPANAIDKIVGTVRTDGATIDAQLLLNSA